MKNAQGFFFPARLVFTLGALALACGAGCRVMRPAKAISSGTSVNKNQVDAIRLQQQLLRFHDDFVGRLLTASDLLRRGTNALDPSELRKWKLAYSGNSLAIASSPNSYVALLDTIVLVTLTHKALQDYWVPEVFGDSAAEMMKIVTESEENIWQMAGLIMDAKAQQELRAAIDEWYGRNHDPNLVLQARAVGFASQIENASQSARKEAHASVFSLLRVDPLSGLDPATRELTQTRLFAERALFVAQRMPALLRWQMELLSANTAALPEIQAVVTNTAQLANAVERVSRLADDLPRLVDQQREAAIRQAFDGIATERKNLVASLSGEQAKLDGTLRELREALAAGDGMARSVDGAVKSLDTFVGRFDKPGPQEPPATNARPFDVLDYARAASEVANAAKELNATVASMDRALPKLNETTDHAANLFFVRALILILLFLIGAVFAGVIYRRLAPPR